ncbi:hypothetical protein [Leptospira meyeri]|uniref:hypothetical protein n=1 Tax=Leptospira meyeri TaxID=29508 RepID=UPI000C2AB72C|nr:hypothetical protein [Leptospira meyeri]PKA21942.1 hypothetical protein CH381_33465 [Leptospira sp. mixed culture ATI2-C-A1]MCW7490615.1 hypothetical protein [Leptospira meyeri]PKA13217.1 hypothetical protein CH372_05075 [Leptospira meyeri]TGM21594.1 hypothetical protein EHQ73_09785 [Leptospira meyeri]TGM61054.1 hypothetical protein EHQ93_16720 [Leptospira meyeri]
MKNKILLTTMLLISIQLNAKIHTLDEEKISFETSDNFQPFSQEIIDLKYPSKRAPKYVIGTKSTKTSIGFDIKDNKIEESNLEDAKKGISESLSKIIPGIKWIKNELITINNKRYILFNFQSNAIDTKINNTMLITNYNGKMLIFNFNSTIDEYPKYKKEFDSIINSIKIEEE